MYSNDLKAPRMRKAKFSKSVITRELWKHFTKSSPEYKGMSWEEFSGLWGDIAETIRQEIITNPLGTKLASYTGELKLQYLCYDVKAKDKKSSNEMGEKVNHINIVTKGKVASIKWERRWAVKFNKMLQFFAFEPTRKLNHMAKAYMDKYPEKLRMARNTNGGFNIWKQIKYDKTYGNREF